MRVGVFEWMVGTHHVIVKSSFSLSTILTLSVGLWVDEVKRLMTLPLHPQLLLKLIVHFPFSVRQTRKERCLIALSKR